MRLSILLLSALAIPAAVFAQDAPPKRSPVPSLTKGEKQLFVDSAMIREKHGITRVVHPAKKLEQPVLRAEMPWEWTERAGAADKRVNIYGTVLRDEKTAAFQMWYADAGHVLYATSTDGIRWERPILHIAGENNRTNLGLHSPSIVLDRFETDPKKRYKAVGNAGMDVADETINSQCITSITPVMND